MSDNTDFAMIVPEERMSDILSGNYEPSFPRWSNQNYEGREKDFLSWMTIAQLESPLLQGIVAGLDGENLAAQVVALARQQALEQLSQFPELADGALFEAINTGIQERWFEDLPIPLSSMEEVFMNIAEGYGEKTTAYYDFLFIAQKVIPAMASLDMDTSVFWKLPQARSKLRAAVPYLREQIPGDHARAPETFTKDAQKQTREVIQAIVDDSVGARDFRQDLQKRRGVYTQTDLIPPFVEEYAIGAEESWFIVKASTRGQRDLVRRQLTKLNPEMNISDILALAKQLSEKITGTPAGRSINVSMADIERLMEGTND